MDLGLKKWKMLKPNAKSEKPASQNPEDAFEHLYEIYLPKVYGFIAYRVATVEEAQDLTAQTFLKAVEKFHTFDNRGEGSFAAWLFRIAHNTVIDFYRRNSTNEEAYLEDLNSPEDDSEPLDEQMANNEVFQRLRTLIRHLPARQQQVVTLRFFAGLRNCDVAEILAIDEKSVAAYLSRAIRDLQSRYIEIYGPFESR